MRRRGRRRLLVSAALGVAALAYLGLWAVTALDFSALVKQLQAQGEPVRPSEMAPKLKPGERNAADEYQQAFVMSAAQAMQRFVTVTPRSWRSQLPRVRSILAANPQYLDALEQASRIEQCDFGLDWDRMMYGYSQLTGLRAGSEALAMQAELQACDGNLDGALDSCATALRIAGHLEQAPGFVEWLLASMTEEQLLGEVRSVLSRGDPSPAACRRLFDQLGQKDYHARFERAMALQRAQGLGALSWMERGGWLAQQPPRTPRWAVRQVYPIIAKPWWNAQKSEYLETMGRYVAAAKRPWPEAAKEAARLDRESAHFAAKSGLIAPEAEHFGRAGHDAAMAGAWQVALALGAYHHDRGVYPATLAEVEKTGWPLPDDPFTGKPYQYRRDQDGFMVWSVGFDLRDDGARPVPDDLEALMSPGYDFVVRCTQ